MTQEKKHICLIILCILSVLPGAAQMIISGVVADSLTRQPVAKANVMVLKNGKTVSFARTDEHGRFTVSTSLSSLQQTELQATAMGFEKKRQPLAKASDNQILLSQKTFEMQEVMVKAGPVTGRKDTITFDLTRYASERDNSLKDVLKKLPGVQVAGNGQISVNGKNLSRFTVEGLDLSDGRYNKLTENIKAKDVKKAEVIEHDQPIKALRNKIYTDNVAMNVVLKDSARDQLSVTLRPYFMVGEPTHVGGTANAMQIGQNRQMMYDVAYDRSGRDVSEINRQFSFEFRAPQPSSLPDWYPVASLQAPISDSRLRFNTSQNYGVSHLTKTKTDAEVRFTAGYFRNVLRQRTDNHSVYYLEDAPTETLEKRNLLLKEDELNFAFNRKLNNDNSYGNIKFTLDASQSDALSMLESTGHGATSQQVRNPEINLSGYISNTYTKRRGTLSWNSILDYHHSRNDLYLDASRSSLNNNLWHTSHSLEWSTRRRYVTQTYDAEVSMEHLNVIHGDTKLAFATSPSWRYERGRVKLSYTQGINMDYYSRMDKLRLYLLPSLYFQYKKSSRTEISTRLSYGESGSDLSDFAIGSYRNSYRSITTAPDFIASARSLNFFMSHSYKKLVREFFVNTQIRALRMWKNSAMDMRISNGNYLYSTVKHNNQYDNVNVGITISKGFYDLHLKTAVTMSGGYSRGEQYSAGNVVKYDYRQLAFNPTLSFAPSWMQVDYEGNFQLGKSHSDNISLATLFNWNQRLKLTSTISNVDISLMGMFYHNELQTSSTVNTFLADAQVVWRLKHVRLSAQLSNILNKRTYVETSYSGVGIFTNEYQLRPREFTLSAQFSL